MAGTESEGDSPRLSGCAAAWTVDLLGQKLLEIAEEQRRLREVPDQLSTLLLRLPEPRPAAEKIFMRRASSPAEEMPRPRGSQVAMSRRQSRCSSDFSQSLATLSESGRSCIGAPTGVSTMSILPSASPMLGGPTKQISASSWTTTATHPVATSFPTVLRRPSGSVAIAGVDEEGSAAACFPNVPQPSCPGAAARGKGDEGQGGDRSRRPPIWSKQSWAGSAGSAAHSSLGGGSRQISFDPSEQIEFGRPETLPRPSVGAASLGSSILSFLYRGSYHSGRRSASQIMQIQLAEVLAADAPDSSCMQRSGWVRVGLDVLMLLIAILTALIVPFTAAYFDRQVGDSTRDIAFMTVLDILWCMGIIANFLTATLDFDEPVYEVRAVAAAYLQSFFLVDLISVWPAAIPPPFVLSPSLCILYMLKLVRLSRLEPLLSRLQVTCDAPKLAQLKRGLQTLILVHILSCGWHFVRRSEGVVEPQGQGSWGSDYVSALYWTSMTVTTVGYGDVVPQGLAGRIYAILAMIVATIFHGTVVSVITHFTAGIFADKVSSHVAEVRRFLLRHGVSRELRGYIEDNLRRRIHMDQQAISRDLLAKLSPSLQRELSLALLRDVILRFPLFRRAPRGFVVEMARAHTMVQCLPGDIIVEDGQVLKELVFVMRGRLVVCSDPRMTKTSFARKRFSQLRPPGMHSDIEAGGWLGEECLFRVLDGDAGVEGDDPMRKCNIKRPEPSSDDDDDSDTAPGAAGLGGQMRAEASSGPRAWTPQLEKARRGVVCAFELAELAVLPSSEYWRVCREFPLSLQRHQKVCNALRTGKLRFDAFAHVASDA